MLVTGLHLRQDLGLPQHQGVQPTAHLEEVQASRLPVVAEEVRLQLLARQARLVAEESFHRLQGGELLQLRGGEVELEAVARGQNCHFWHQVTVLRPGEVHQFLSIGIPLCLGHRELLAHLHWGTVMAEPNHVHLHHRVHSVAVAGEALNSILLNLANPVLGLPINLVDLPTQLTLADALCALPQAIDGRDQGAQELVHLPEDAPQLRLPQLLHGHQHVPQLP
mmetsp:Transcript_119083/g.282543  ORF Transcript_119083/g.282543 Transcript_119083/m.282543 type:complete len:223 (+) Transcript_119083:1084-1752(+)